jgi:hypothetical protein
MEQRETWATAQAYIQCQELQQQAHYQTKRTIRTPRCLSDSTGVAARQQVKEAIRAMDASNDQQYGSFKVWTEARMYHAIVKRIALQNFLRVNQKDYAPT